MILFTFFSIWCDVSNFLPFLELLHFYVLENILVKKFPSGQWAVYFIFPIYCLLLQLIKVKNSTRVKMSSWRFLFFVNSFPMFVFKIHITSQCRLHMVEHSWFAFENRWLRLYLKSWLILKDFGEKPDFIWSIYWQKLKHSSQWSWWNNRHWS